MQQARINFTWHDLQLLPQDQRYEILDGSLLTVSSPDSIHRGIVCNLEATLRHQMALMDWGAIFHTSWSVVLSKTTLVIPDIFAIRKARLGIIQGRRVLGAPDLIIEIDSKNNRAAELTAKRRIYARHGLREYWIVSPSIRRVEVLIWSEAGYVKTQQPSGNDRVFSPLLPMLQVHLTQIFQMASYPETITYNSSMPVSNSNSMRTISNPERARANSFKSFTRACK